MQLRQNLRDPLQHFDLYGFLQNNAILRYPQFLAKHKKIQELVPMKSDTGRHTFFWGGAVIGYSAIEHGPFSSTINLSFQDRFNKNIPLAYTSNILLPMYLHIW